MKMFRNSLLLDKDAEKGLRAAAVSCFFTSLSLMIPFMITIRLCIEVLNPLIGEDVSWNKIWILFGAGIVAFIIVFLLSKHDYLKTYVFSYNQSEATRLRVAEKMLKLPMSFFNARDLSELSSNIMTDCTNIETATSSIVPQLLANIASSVFVLICLAFFDWRMALSIFAMLPIAALVFWMSRKLQNRLFVKHISAKLASEKQSQEYLDGIKVIRSCNLGGEKYKKLDEAFTELRKVAIRIELASGSVMALSSMLLRSGIGITVFVGVHLLTAGRIDFLVMLMFLIIVSRIYGPILTVLTLLPDILYLKASSKRIRALMESQAMTGEVGIPIENMDISFDNVSFAYGEENVLDEVSFTAKTGQITALVGPSGSGKSTISKLAARFWDADAGRVNVGGVNVKDLDPEYLMKHFSFVFQDVILFNDTIENNIRIGNLNAGEEEIRAAAKAACCDEFIEKLPDGYQTMLGENGATLSGGERQRISIARALLKDAPVVILDEATASLDPENEVFVQKAINRLVDQKTVLVIAHRLRTILHADHIVVLENGKVIEEGKGEELLANNGLFSKMYNIQQSNCEWGV